MCDLREVHALHDGDILELQLKDSGEPVLAMMVTE